MPTDPEKQRPKISGRRVPAKPGQEPPPDLTAYEPIFPRTPEERKGNSHLWAPARLAEQQRERAAKKAAEQQQQQPPEQKPEEPPAT